MHMDWTPLFKLGLVPAFLCLLLSGCINDIFSSGNSNTAQDTSPDTFIFNDRTDVAVNSIVSSDDITISGITAPTKITVSGGEYAIGGGNFTSAAGTVSVGQTIVVRHTSSATHATATNTLVTIGGVSDAFSSTTLTADTVPDTFSLNDQTNVALNAAVSSNSITVSGINTATTISVSDGEYAIDEGSFTSATGTVTDGQTVTVRHTSSALETTITSSQLSIGGVSKTFTSTTGFVGTGFNRARGPNNDVHSVNAATDSSGDIYIGGAFDIYNSSSTNRIARINSDGSVDTGFAVGTGFNNEVNVVVPATDGSGDVYVGGNFTNYQGTGVNRIVRLNSDGTIDTDFSVGTGFSTEVSSISLAEDSSGDVYVGGNFTSYNGIGSINRIVRLNNDGTQDAGFNIGAGFNGNNDVRIILNAGDGSGDVYIGGNFNDYDGTNSNRIIRLKSDGSIDTDFAIGTGFNSTVESMAIDSDGDVYAGGNFSSFDGTSVSRIVRLNSDGSIDAGFNSGTGLNQSAHVIKLATDGSGDVFVGGLFNTYNGSSSSRIVRINSDGSVDGGFALGTGFIGNGTFGVYAIDHLSSGGELYAGGAFDGYNGTGTTNFIRLDNDGIGDPQFATGSGFSTSVESIAAATDGSGHVYVGTQNAYYGGISRGRFYRLSEDGALDNAFPASTVGGNTGDIAPLSDGDVYASAAGIVRFNNDGTTDTGFISTAGFVNTEVIARTTDGSGNIYVGGNFTNYNGTASSRLVRLNNDGTADATFNVGSGFNNYVLSLSPATDGSNDLYVGGMFTSYNGTAVNRLVRLNEDGSIDAGFAVGSGFNDRIFTLATPADGSGDVYAGGWFTSYDGTSINRIVRLNSDGTIDTGFSVGSGLNNRVTSSALATDGSSDIYVGGIFTHYDGVTVNRLVRLNSDGSHDTAFATGSSFNNTVNAVATATDGSNDVFAGGVFTAYQTTHVGRIVRLNPDGSLN